MRSHVAREIFFMDHCGPRIRSLPAIQSTTPEHAASEHAEPEHATPELVDDFEIGDMILRWLMILLLYPPYQPRQAMRR